jgi:lactoylglutathione lyase
MLRVKDLERSLEFYVGFIGLRELRRREIGDEAILVFLVDDDGRHQIELTWNRGKTDYELGNQFGHLAFGTPDLEAVVREVESRGWWFRRSRSEMSSRYIFVKDPDGYDVEILERGDQKPLPTAMPTE